MAENNFNSDDLRDLADKADAFTRALQGAAKQEEAKKKAREAAIKGYADLAKSLGAAGKAALSSEETQYKYAAAIKQAANGASGALSQFGAFGKGLGLLIELGGEVAGAVLKFNDSLVRTNKTLGQTGQSLGLTSKRMMELAHNAGYTSKTIDNWAGLLTKHSVSTLYFGKTASAGTEALNDLLDVSQDQRSQFYNLGYTVDGLNDTLLEYAGLSGKYGNTKNTKNLQKEAFEYAETLQVLTGYTGESRDALKKRMDDAANDLAFNLALRRASPDQKKELEKLAMATGANGKALRDWASGKGFKSDEGVALMVSTNGEIQNIMDDFNNKKIDADEVLKRVAKSQQDYTKSIGATAIQMTNIDKAAGLSVAQMSENNRIQNANLNDAEKEARDKKDRYDPALKTDTDRISSELKVQRTIDQTMDIVSGPVTSTFTTFMKLANKVADEFNQITTSVGNFLGKTFGEETVKVEKQFTREKIESFLASGLSEADIQLSTGKSTGELKEWLSKSKKGDILTSTVEMSKTMAETTQYGQGETTYSAGTKTGTVGDILNYIGGKESRGNYNILVGGKTNPNLTNMTIAEVLAYQKTMKAQGHESTAVGKYQIIQGTLRGLVNSGYAKLDDKFDARTQDNLAEGLLKQRGLDSFLSGKMSTDQFADNLSKEWASLPYHTGASFYAGVGSNRSLGSRQEFTGILSGGGSGRNTVVANEAVASPIATPVATAPAGPQVVSGPNSGYPTRVAAGKTAVVPTNGKGITMQRAGGGTNEMNGKLVENMMEIFDDIIDGLKKRASNQQQLLRYARN